MSKAFTRESDEDQGVVLPPRAPLPPGIKNYITSAGAQKLRDELDFFSASPPDDANSSWREARARQLREIIASLVVAEKPAEKDVVRFGALVTVQRKSGTEAYRLVGVDETDLDRNEISWISPLAKALLGKKMGERVLFRSPDGAEELTILAIEYP